MQEFGYISVIRLDGLKGNSFPITSSQIVIGRSLDCDIRIHLPGVSEKHCLIVFKDNIAYCKPLDGAIVVINDEPMACDALLKSGDRIKIAQRALIFDYPQQKVEAKNQANNLPASTIFYNETVNEEEFKAEIAEPSETPNKANNGGRCTPTPEINAPSAESLLFSPKKTPTSSARKVAVAPVPEILSPRKHSPRISLDNSPAINEDYLVKKTSKPSTPTASNSLKAVFDSTANYMVKPVARMLKAEIESPRKSVSFGPSLSPELFDKEMPPVSPLRRGTPSKKPLPVDPSKTMLKSVLKRETVKITMPKSAPAKNVRPVEKIEMRPLHFSPQPKKKEEFVDFRIDNELSLKLTPASNGQRMSIGGGSAMVGIRELLKTPKQIPDFKGLEALKTLVKTPKQSELKGLDGVKNLVKTPKPSNYEGLDDVQYLVKTPLKPSSEVKKTPKKHTPVRMDSEMKQTPIKKFSEVKKTPVKQLSEVKKTPVKASSPIKHEIEGLSQVKKLMKTPEKHDDFEGLDAVKVLVKTPKQPEFNGLEALKKLVKTPLEKDFQGLEAIKKLVKTPKENPQPVGLESLKHLMRSNDAILNAADTPKDMGLRRMMKSPSTRKSMVGLESLEQLLETPTHPTSHLTSPGRTEAVKPNELPFETPAIDNSVIEKPHTPAKPSSARSRSIPASQPEVLLNSVPDVPELPLEDVKPKRGRKAAKKVLGEPKRVQKESSQVEKKKTEPAKKPRTTKKVEAAEPKTTRRTNLETKKASKTDVAEPRAKKALLVAQTKTKTSEGRKASVKSVVVEDVEKKESKKPKKKSSAEDKENSAVVASRKGKKPTQKVEIVEEDEKPKATRKRKITAEEAAAPVSIGRNLRSRRH